jgi:hypothetical protein
MKAMKWVMVLVLVLVGRAQAWVPSDWVYMTEPYAYSTPIAGWVYFNEGDTQWVCDLQTGQWALLDQRPMGSGWCYFIWPYGYSASNNHWFYFLTGSSQYCLSFLTGTWGLLGTCNSSAKRTTTWAASVGPASMGLSSIP